MLRCVVFQKELIANKQPDPQAEEEKQAMAAEISALRLEVLGAEMQMGQMRQQLQAKENGEAEAVESTARENTLLQEREELQTQIQYLTAELKVYHSNGLQQEGPFVWRVEG